MRRRIDREGLIHFSRVTLYCLETGTTNFQDSLTNRLRRNSPWLYIVYKGVLLLP